MPKTVYASASLNEAAQSLFETRLDRLRRSTDNLFSGLMALQYVFVCLAAITVTPWTWIGAESKVHAHVWAALGMGALLTAFPLFLKRIRPGSRLTRFAFATAQIGYSALIVHVLGGRIEAHFHVFGSLAFLAFYRDGSVVVWASALVVLDHFVRGVFWPESVFGTGAVESLRWLEHSAWVAFEDVFLLISCRRSLAEMQENALQTSELEFARVNVDAQVAQRTSELQESQLAAQEAADQLRAATRRLKTATDAAAMGVWEYDIPSGRLDWDESMHRLFGTDLLKHEPHIDLWRSLLHPEDRHRVMQSLRNAAVGPAPFVTSFRIIRDDCEMRYVHASAIVERNRAGAPVRITGFCQDVTREAKAEEELRASEREARRLSLIAERTTNAVMLTDAEHRIEWVNDGFTRTTGYTLDEVRGKLPAQFLECEETDPATIAAIQEALERHRPFHGEIYNRGKQGNGYWLSIDIQPVYENDRLIGFMAVENDITELRNSKLAAEAANKAKSEFLANMSHEIRTPMTAILGYADLLLTEEGICQAPSHRVDALKSILANGEHLLEIINDVLDISKIEAEKIELERIECSPLEICRDALALVQVRADGKNLLTGLHVDGKIPRTICSDPTRLRQILLNLLANAIKFTEIGGVTMSLRAVSRGERREFEFEIADSGIGISPEHLGRLFQPFTQADATTTRRFGGTGLGLSISRRLARMLGGDIRVESEVGKGSRFTVSIDPGELDDVDWIDAAATAVSQAEPAPPADQPETAPGNSDSLEGLRILFAEDGPDNQRLISFLLRRAGADVTLAENGQMAVDEASAAEREGRPFDVVLMDMQMPVLDGYGATRALRSDGYPRPIIALTANAMSHDRQKCLDAGCDDYLSKPIDKTKLFDVCSKFGRIAAYAARAAGESVGAGI